MAEELYEGDEDFSPEQRNGMRTLMSIYADIERRVEAEILHLLRSGQPITPGTISRMRAWLAGLFAGIRANRDALVHALAYGSYRVGQRIAIGQIAKGRQRAQLRRLAQSENVAVQLIAQTGLDDLDRIEDAVRLSQHRILAEAGVQHTAEVLAERGTPRDAAKRIEEAAIRAGITKTQEGGLRLVQINGRNYQLDKHARLIARTMMKDAMIKAAKNTLLANGYEIVEVVGHPSDSECGEWVGGTYSLTDGHPEYPYLEELPPYHPNCRCSIRAVI